MAKSTWGGLTEEMTVVEPGMYSVEVVSLEDKLASSGAPMLVLGVKIMDDGPFQGRKLWTNFVKSSEVARNIFGRFAKIVGLTVDENDEFDLENAYGARLRVQVEQRTDERTGEIRADIKRFMSLQ